MHFFRSLYRSFSRYNTIDNKDMVNGVEKLRYFLHFVDQTVDHGGSAKMVSN